MLVIGLTGGIGSGKTTVANLFAALGTPIIDTDLIARQLVEPGEPALSEIVDHFGKEILLANGELDRSKLADITFQDKQNRQQLEAILHPRIRQEMRRQLAAVQSPYAIVVIPLLVETQQMQEVDRVLLVDCPENIQMQRIQARDNRPIQQIESIIQSQASRQQRLQFADDVVNNVASMEELKDQVAQLHHKYSGLSPN